VLVAGNRRQAVEAEAGAVEPGALELAAEEPEAVLEPAAALAVEPVVAPAV